MSGEPLCRCHNAVLHKEVVSWHNELWNYRGYANRLRGRGSFGVAL